MRNTLKVWPWAAAILVAVLTMTVGTVFAHEGREVEGYRLIVGWAVEPAYEDHKNAVQLKVTKIDAAQDHHGSIMDDSSSEANGGSGNAMADHHASTVQAESLMAVDVAAALDSVSGVNVQIMAQGFAFTPENVNQDHVPGEGHAHVYVDGVKLGRAFTPWQYIGDLEPGMHEIRVTLNANGHSDYTWDGSLVEATTHVVVPEPNGMSHPHGATVVEAASLMSVSLELVPDVDTGANLYVDTQGFVFAPQSAGDAHVPGEGHAHVYVNGVKIGRLYGTAFPLSKLAEGANEVRVTLNTNSHDEYTWDGGTVDAVATIHIQPGMGGPGYGANDDSMQGDMDGDSMESDHHGSTDGGSAGEEHSSGVATADGAMAGPASQAVGSPEAPVEGLQSTLLVEVTHVSSESSKVLNVNAVPDDPGYYTADLIPTASGVYQFRVFGTIEGVMVDETFVSKGGGGDFDDVQSSAALQFPVELPETRELESAVRGAMQTAQQAQDSALAVEADAGTDVLVIVALALAAVGGTAGLLGLYLALRRR